MIGDLSYTSYGFNWNDGKNLEETMTRFSNLQSSRAARKSNDGREKASTDRLSIEQLDQSGVVAGLAACPMLTRSFVFIYNSCSNFLFREYCSQQLEQAFKRTHRAYRQQ
jgi:hypothetical protein